MDNERKKVLFLIPTTGSGGIESYLLRFIKQSTIKINASIIVRGDKQGELLSEYTALELPLYFMPLTYFSVVNWIRYYRYFKKGRFDTICDFNANFAGIPMLLAKLAGFKIE